MSFSNSCYLRGSWNALVIDICIVVIRGVIVVYLWTEPVCRGAICVQFPERFVSVYVMRCEVNLLRRILQLIHNVDLLLYLPSVVLWIVIRHDAFSLPVARHC